jgi:hypothetical protein
MGSLKMETNEDEQIRLEAGKLRAEWKQKILDFDRKMEEAKTEDLERKAVRGTVITIVAGLLTGALAAVLL